MKHYTLEQWDLYAGDQLSDEERLAYETHLSLCEPCLELYMQSLERAAGSYPALEDEAALAEVVMEQISREEPLISPASLPLKTGQPRAVGKSPAFTKHPLFHYAVAAAITGILMGSGAFQSLTERIGHFNAATEPVGQEQGVEQPGKPNGSASFSYKIMEKTIVMLDSIQPKHEKGGTR